METTESSFLITKKRRNERNKQKPTDWDMRGGERLREIEHAWQGILLVLPSPERPEVEIEDYAVSLIRRAIGYHVRLRV